MSSIKGYKCPHCEYYMWEGKEFYECEFQDKVSELEQENAELKAENERLKEEFRIESLTNKTTRETIYRSNLVNKYRTTLQEIKAIAEAGMHCEGMGCDFMPKILDLITKAEEE